MMTPPARPVARPRLPFSRLPFACLALVVLSQVGLGALFLSSSLAAAEITQQQENDFETHIRPTLTTRCLHCHGPGKQEGGLQVTTLELLLKGGDSGPALIPGKPDESLLVEAIRYEGFEMPPDGQLKKPVIQAVEKWIAAGAAWPPGVELKSPPKITAEDRQWWCIQPITDPAVPVVDDGGWCRNEIDRFLFARLAKEGIEPAAEASPAALQRRLHFALTGLPPQTEAASAALDYEGLVDRLLQEETYGENQARYWLDLVRYAESDGYRADFARPQAHQYRDYVIRSFNADKPYDQFVTEQLAGDETDPGNRDALVATMFLRHWIYEWNQRDVEGQWQAILDDVTETTADAFLAMGLKCARCHDHKFDPLLQQDYYRLKAFFAPLLPREDLPIADVDARREYEQQLAVWEQATADIRQKLFAIENPVLLKHSTREGVKRFVPEIRDMISKRPGERLPYEHQIASLAGRQFDVHPDKLPEWLDEKTEATRQELLQQLAQFDEIKPQPLPTLSYVVSDVGPQAPPTLIPGLETAGPVAPGFPTILDSKPASIIPPPPALASTGRRTALAGWITDPQNPLTARVMVNRVWQQHFGRGLVETSSDFGHLGAPPSHPELLDWLSRRFMEDGWSLKKLHRRILTSAAYRQTSQRPLTDELARKDIENQLLWRMSPRRLSGEEIADAMLSASGELEGKKRAIYKPVKRNQPDPLAALFDFPDRIRSTGKRHRTTTSTQALMLLNNSWTYDRARAMVRTLPADDDEAFLHQAYQRLFARPPVPQEIALGRQFLQTFTETVVAEKPAPLLAKLPSGQPAFDVAAKDPAFLLVPSSERLPQEDFTVRATVMLRSLYADASVRTIVTHWNGNAKSPGWSLGVTSTRSAYKPKNLILQLVGQNEAGQTQYEVVPSNLRLELNKPYEVAVRVKLADRSPAGITFYLRDLSVPGAKLQTASVKHTVVSGIRPSHALGIGSRDRSHNWEGLLGPIRLYDLALPEEEWMDEGKTNASASLPVLDLTFADADKPGADASTLPLHAQVQRGSTVVPGRQAQVALLHALLNSNEMIYLD
ncbi:DUF1553 domain-containing protein [Lignipirellula cremea]|uniref:Planctomycete cytochrome C n=1 Tax=Lignipirellula cremea TaxID=2528010 RepID=A0A518DLX7_9BACT|nr:DUF1553 domain-containing protein [Lignipirellula cremea]QDU92846.1 Planctomycete cytochrome C [Lignipirellula cremea]